MSCCEHHGLQPHWVVSIFDRAGIIAARTLSPERFVGHPGAPALLKAMEQSRAGVLETATVEGISVLAGFSRSEVSNWSVAIGIPVAELSREMWIIILLGTSGAATLLGVGIALAAYQSSRIASSVQCLIAPALSLGRGEVPKIPQLPVKEADDVAQALDRAFHLLQSRTVERDRAQREKEVADYLHHQDGQGLSADRGREQGAGGVRLCGLARPESAAARHRQRVEMAGGGPGRSISPRKRGRTC